MHAHAEPTRAVASRMTAAMRRGHSAARAAASASSAGTAQRRRPSAARRARTCGDHHVVLWSIVHTRHCIPGVDMAPIRDTCVPLCKAYSAPFSRARPS